jgi:hypothetical protein
MKRKQRNGSVGHAAALACVVLAFSACGPKDLFQVGVRQVPDSVVLGAQHKPTPQAQPPAEPLFANLESGSPGFLVPPIPQFSVGMPTPGPAPTPTCPRANPFGAVTPEATNGSQTAPRPGVYHYRQSGSYQKKGQPAYTYPPSTEITVMRSYVGKILANGSHDPTDPYIYWDQVEKSIAPDGTVDSTITYTFQLSPDTFIRIYQISVANTNGTDVYQPSQGATSGGSANGADYIVYPASGLPIWSDNAYDVPRQKEFVDNGAISPYKDHVDACGHLVDSWQVTVSPSTTTTVQESPAPTQQVGPTKQQSVFHYLATSSLDYNIDGFYDIATQFQGLLVASHILETAVDGSWTNTRDLTINSVEPDPLPSH